MPAEFRNWETNQKPLIYNILPAASTKDKLLAVIFPFKLEKITSVPLFSRATKPITMMYIDAKVDSQYIKLILDSESAGSIITKQLMDQLADGATKTLIGEIDDFPFEVNDIIVLIKVLVIEATQYQALSSNSAKMVNIHVYQPYAATSRLSTHQHHSLSLRKKRKNLPGKPIKSHKLTMITMNYCQYSSGMTMTMKKENKERNIPGKPPSMLGLTTAKGKRRKKKKTYLEKSNSQKTQPKDEQVHTLFASYYYSYHLFYLNAKTMQTHYYYKLCHCKCYDIQSAKTSKTMNYVSLVVNSYSMKRCEMTFLVEEEHIWQIANAKVQGAMPSKILKVKNNPPEQVDIILIPNPDAFLDIETNSENFYEHYQNLAPTRKEQEECLAQLNTQLCDHCLILCDFQYCNECDLIYNPPIHMIYMISEEEEPISSCTLESESIFNPDSNSNNNDDKNNGSSFI
ncbi:hypothetical protein G9A89_021999 [Geosiphon pyriformis]|nr:hypothetical protein G9A89_021999 [Geosiphon pyriformis]